MENNMYMFHYRQNLRDFNNCNCRNVSSINEFLAGFNMFILFITICMLMYIDTKNNANIRYNEIHNNNEVDENEINGYEETEDDVSGDDVVSADDDEVSGDEGSDDEVSGDEGSDDEVTQTDNSLKRRTIQKSGSVTSYFSFWN